LDLLKKLTKLRRRAEKIRQQYKSNILKGGILKIRKIKI